MNLLLDTHVFIWLMLDSSKLGRSAIDAIRAPENAVSLSVASAWEMAIKQSIGKLQLPGPARTWVPMACSRGGIELVSVDSETALAVGDLPWHHRDPFDRLLVAQAANGFTLLTRDRALEAYGVPILRA